MKVNTAWFWSKSRKGTYTCGGVGCSLWMQSDWTISKIISTRWWVYPQVLRSKMEKPLITCKMRSGWFYTCSSSHRYLRGHPKIIRNTLPGRGDVGSGNLKAGVNLRWWFYPWEKAALFRGFKNHETRGPVIFFSKEKRHPKHGCFGGCRWRPENGVSILEFLAA